MWAWGSDVEGVQVPLIFDLRMNERGSATRHLFLLAAVGLAFLAFVRLGVLLSRPMGAGKTSPAGPTLVAKEISLEVKGPNGDAIRLHFPEVPLNIDNPYQTGRLTVVLKLNLTRTPGKVICQVLKGGRVVAQSEPRSLAEGEKVDLGNVEVKTL